MTMKTTPLVALTVSTLLCGTVALSGAPGQRAPVLRDERSPSEPGPASAGANHRTAMPASPEPLDDVRGAATPVVAEGSAADEMPSPWSDDRRLTAHPALSQTSINFVRGLAAGRRGRLHLVWEDKRDGVSQVYYLRSDRSGHHWEEPLRLSLGGLPNRQPAVAAEGSQVHVVWHEELGGGASRVLYRRSLDRGQSWLPPQEFSHSVPAAHASVASHGSRVHVTWTAVENGYNEVFTRRSGDGGGSWEAPLRVSSGPYPSWVPSVTVEGELVLVAWVDYRDANEEEYLRISRDGGSSWDDIQRLTVEPADSWAPTVTSAGGLVHIAWFDRRAAGVSDADVESAVNDALNLVGVPTQPPPPRDPAVYYLPEYMERLSQKKLQLQMAAPPWVAAGGDVEELERRIERFESLEFQWTTGWEIYTRRSPDAGRTWEPTRRQSFAPMPSQRPTILADGNRLHMVWFDSRDGNEELYYRQSLDGGQSWLPEERLTVAPGASAHPMLALTATSLYVAWYDERDGNSEIYIKHRPR